MLGANPNLAILTIYIKGRERGMSKYETNWFKCLGLYIISAMIQTHLGVMGNFLISFLLFFSAGMISIERTEK